MIDPAGVNPRDSMTQPFCTHRKGLTQGRSNSSVGGAVNALQNAVQEPPPLWCSRRGLTNTPDRIVQTVSFSDWFDYVDSAGPDST